MAPWHRRHQNHARVRLLSRFLELARSGPYWFGPPLPWGGLLENESPPKAAYAWSRNAVGARSIARSRHGSRMCPERVGAALTLQPVGGTAVVQNGLAPSGSRSGQRCIDALPKLLWCAHWGLGAGLVNLGPEEG